MTDGERPSPVPPSCSLATEKFEKFRVRDAKKKLKGGRRKRDGVCLSPSVCSRERRRKCASGVGRLGRGG